MQDVLCHYLWTALWKYLFHLCVLYATGLKVIALQTISFYLSEVFKRSILFPYNPPPPKSAYGRQKSFVLSLPFSAEWSKETTDWSWQEGGNSHFHFGAINQINRDPADNAKKKKKCCSLQWQVSRASEPMWKENGANNLSLGNTVTHTSEQQLLPFLCCSTIIRMWYKFVHFFCCSYRRSAYVR